MGAAVGKVEDAIATTPSQVGLLKGLIRPKGEAFEELRGHGVSLEAPGAEIGRLTVPRKNPDPGVVGDQSPMFTIGSLRCQAGSDDGPHMSSAR